MTINTQKRHKTIYNPGVAMTFYIRNLKTNEKVRATTLSIRDEEQKPWRSPKGTPDGQQFFKMKSGLKDTVKYHKFNNSNQNELCLSEDGAWIFEGERIDGTLIPKVDEICKIKHELKRIEKEQQKGEIKDTKDYNIREYTTSLYQELVLNG